MPNVKAGIRARLVRPKYPENKGLICTVVRKLPTQSIIFDQLVWYCEFDQYIQTSLGYLPVATIRDTQLEPLEPFEPEIEEQKVKRERELA